MAFSNFGANSRDSTVSDTVFKIILIGDQDVGKSSILTRFLEGSFSEDKIRTYGNQTLSRRGLQKEGDDRQRHEDDL